MTDILKAFWVGGVIGVIGQILIDKTKLTSGRILVLYVCIGAILGGLGIYKIIADYAGAGATVPILGFGYNLSKSVLSDVSAKGFTGIFTGSLKAAAGGISATILFGFISALIFDPKEK